MKDKIWTNSGMLLSVIVTGRFADIQFVVPISLFMFFLCLFRSLKKLLLKKNWNWWKIHLIIYFFISFHFYIVFLDVLCSFYYDANNWHTFLLVAVSAFQKRINRFWWECVNWHSSRFFEYIESKSTNFKNYFQST